MRILIYGDSNTFGYDPRSLFGGRYSEEYRWPDILARNLEGKAEIISRGMNGRTIPVSDYEIESVDKMISGLSTPDYFAIMLGTNDILLTNTPDWKTAAARMSYLLEHISRNHETSIILIVPPIVFPGSPVGSPYRPYEENAHSLAEAYRKIAAEKGYLFVDASLWNVDLEYDGVHISERGNIEFAAHITEYISNNLF